MPTLYLPHALMEVGQMGSYVAVATTVLNPQGFDAILAAGGCITDHIQIGGQDFGNTGYPGALYSCSCSAGWAITSIITLFISTWPSFAQISVGCATNLCPKGKYFSSGCVSCPSGMRDDIFENFKLTASH